MCYSTCLGNLQGVTGENLAGASRRLGVSTVAMPHGAATAMADDMIIAPNRCMFVPPSNRVGVLPRLLSEVRSALCRASHVPADATLADLSQILDTRVMVKAALKAAPADARVLQRCLTARQLGLKLIANVTYGELPCDCLHLGVAPLLSRAPALRLHGRQLFWPHATARACRRHRVERAAHAGARGQTCEQPPKLERTGARVLGVPTCTLSHR